MKCKVTDGHILLFYNYKNNMCLCACVDACVFAWPQVDCERGNKFWNSVCRAAYSSLTRSSFGEYLFNIFNTKRGIKRNWNADRTDNQKGSEKRDSKKKKKWEKLRCENLCKKALDFSLKFEQKLYTQQVDDVIMLQACIQDGVVLHHVVFNT